MIGLLFLRYEIALIVLCNNYVVFHAKCLAAIKTITGETIGLPEWLWDRKSYYVLHETVYLLQPIWQCAPLSGY